MTTITYEFGARSGTQAWNSAYKVEFRKALATIEAVANIDFVETSGGNADLVEVIAPGSFFSSANTLGYHYTPSSRSSEGAFNTAYWTATAGSGGNGDPGGFFFTTLIHELGHALGLGHPHDTSLGTTVMSGVTSAFNSFGVGNLNQGVYTVMSYNDGWTSQNGGLSVNATYGGSTGFGALDIAALQAMYGANTSYKTGNDVYTLPSANVAGTGYMAIWDAGGNDTIQHTGGSNAYIDLRPATLDYSTSGGGIMSYATGIKGGFTIAHGATIENASGGWGDDIIVGNTAQNTLRGNHGHDTIHSLSDGTNNNTIYGGDGNDTIHVAYGSGSDQVFGDQGNDIAIVNRNGGSFSGGTGTDAVRFVSAASNYLFISNGASYDFLDVTSRVTFTVGSDVELIEFSNVAQPYTRASIPTEMQLSDIDGQGTTLKHAKQGLYVLDAGGANIGLIYNGQGVGANSIA
ncbi:M10 family metallopeptidase, partial [Ruegeria sp. 6PALISEP08]|uniref:M10 family metallopeptidase n=1 Tax=Ruegeria sp. 6PALISEP08 TaxID=1225660 RepID=UPI00067ECF2A